MWAEGYTPDEIVVCLSMDFMTLDEDMNSICTLTEEDVQEGYNFLDTKMKKHFLAVYELED